LDATTIGSVLGFAGVLAAAVVAYFGKRGETAVTGYSSLTDQLQEELASKRAELVEKNAALAEKDARIAELSSYRAADQAEIARLRATIIHLGGQP
jgi:cell division protein FtsB